MNVTQNGHKAPAVAFRIWGVNRWLRYTGVRLFVTQADGVFTSIGLMWVGLPGSEDWRRWET